MCVSEHIFSNKLQLGVRTNRTDKTLYLIYMN